MWDLSILKTSSHSVYNDNNCEICLSGTLRLIVRFVYLELFVSFYLQWQQVWNLSILNTSYSVYINSIHVKQRCLHFTCFMLFSIEIWFQGNREIILYLLQCRHLRLSDMLQYPRLGLCIFDYIVSDTKSG